MPHLALSLLGPWQVTLDGQPVTGFKSNKVRALLVFLAVEADRRHRREMLAGLLWPDRHALSNLRYALSDLRGVIGDREAEPPYLLITRGSLQFNTGSDYWLDVEAFTQGVKPDTASHFAVDRLENAVALYQGAFLESFSIRDSAAFEEWALMTRGHTSRLMTGALHRLAAIYEQRGEYERAQQYAWRQIEREPWDETAHQQLMRILALSGQRAAALAQYETCRRLLAAELGVEPGVETTRLYEQIRDGPLSTRRPVPAPEWGAKERMGRGENASAPAPPPAFLTPTQTYSRPPVPFVARQRELARLDGYLHAALAGQGRVAFITGEVGSGKTTLLRAFTRLSQASHPDLVVAGGECNAYTGIGDPYLPFREMLELLTGDIEAEWAAGAITQEHAGRLWHTLPVTAQALVEAGPDLIDTFLPRAALLERAVSYTKSFGRKDWLIHLRGLLERRPVSSGGAVGPQQSDLFEQYTKVLQAVARRRPLLLTLDEMQWADLGSVSLLFHLGRRLAASRILVVGAFRPEDVAIGRDGERHPLEHVVNEFQRGLGDITVDLGQAESRDFVEAFLDRAPNRLGATFREVLFRQTHGHPLFTIELLHGLQERGDLVRDSEGRWVAGPALDWDSLPARVEAVIAERIDRLAPPLRAVLRVASVEGETFTAEVVAHVRALDEQQMLEQLSGELDRRHRLIQAQSVRRVDGQLLSRYRFRHILFQKYLYGSLDEVERVHLHEQVGTALEHLYGSEEEAAAIAMQLALHFQKAGITEKAVHYLHLAGEKAVRLSAYQEGIEHLTRALDLLMTLPDTRERERQELALRLALGMAWTDTAAPETEKAYVRARELCQKLGETTQLSRVLSRLAVLHYVRAEYQKARELAAEALSLAEEIGDPLLVLLSHWHVGFILFSLGQYTQAHAHLKEVITVYEPGRHHRALVSLHGVDAGVSALAYDACVLWCLGYPEQALRRRQEALALAHQLNHPFSLADVLCFGGCLFDEMRRDAPALQEDAAELMRLSEGMSFSSWLSAATCYRGQALAILGQVQEGIAQLRKGMAAHASVGTRCYTSGTLGALAEAQAKAGQPKEGLLTLAEAFAFVEETDERYREAELHRLRAELLLMQGSASAAEASLQQAIAVARCQSARAWELRATTDLARLWQRQGKVDAAQETLAEIYGWFTEGFDTRNLKEAQALLEDLPCN